MKKLFTLITLLAMCVSGAWAEDKVLNATVSATYINAGADNTGTNYSEAGVLYANFSKVSGGVLTDQLSAYGGSDITIVKFDASALPSGATIKSATVTFTSQCTVSGKNSQLAIVPIGTEWTASEATWNNVDKSANSSQVTNLAYSSSTATSQTYDAKNVLNNDADKIVAFAIFTNTGRQQKITNLALKVTYTEEVLNNRSYIVNAVCGSDVLKQLATGSALEKQDYSVSSLPYMIMKDNVCYKLNDAAVSGYAKSFTMPTGSDAVTNTVSYSASDMTYFFEAESIVSKTYDKPAGAYSGGTTAGVYIGANLTISSISAGVYTVTVNTSVRRANEDIFTVQTSTDGTNWTDAGTITLTSNVGGDYSAENITLAADGSIRLVEAKSQNMCHYVDYVTLKKTGDVTPSSSVTYATYYSTYAFNIPENTEAFTAKLNGNKLILSKLEGSIPAGTPVILKIGGESTSSKTGTATDNDLKGTVTAIETSSITEGTVCVLGKVDGVWGFYKYTGEKLAANKAYLVVPEESAAKGITLVFDEGTATAITSYENENQNENGAAYNLAGQRVAANQKGIVIINGKKFINK